MTTTETTRLPDPDGCFWCDTPPAEHARRWHPIVGVHGYSEPTEAQRRERTTSRPPLFLEGDRVYIDDDRINGLFDTTARITTGNADGGNTVVGELSGGIARYVFLVSDLELVTEEAASHA